MPTNSTRSQLSALSSTNFPDNTNQEISPADLRQWLEDGTTSFVTQKDKSTLENAIYESMGSSIGASPTVNLASATGNFLHITGTGQSISSFGTCPAGARFVLVFDNVNTLVYNATSLILPGLTNIITAAGDTIMLVSEGLGNWRGVAYFRATGTGLGTITGVTAGTGLSGGGVSGNVTLNLNNITPDPSGVFTNADITVDAQGRITAASSGSPGGVTSVTATTPLASSGGTTPNISIQDAAADGGTKGAATFTSSDFNSSSGLISIDYANGQKANGGQDGFLSQGDWSNFDGKQDALSAGSGISIVSNTVTNTAPDQTVTLTPGTGIGVTGTYPSFTISNTSPSSGGTITALTGDVTASGSGSVAATIANDAVTYAKIQNVTASRLLGNPSGTLGDVQEITLGTNLSFTGTTLNATGGGGGIPGGSNTELQYNNSGAFGGVSDATWDNSSNKLYLKTPRIGVGNGNGHYHVRQATNIPSTESNYTTMFSRNGTGGGTIGVKAGTYATELSFATPTSDRVITIPDATDTLVGKATTDTLTNKTLTSPSITTPSITTPSITGVATLGNGTSAGEIRLLEGSAGGSNYIALKSPATLASDVSYTLPNADGSSGFVLQTNGAGSLGWVQNGGSISSAYMIDTTVTQVTGTTSETLLKSILITPNTFASNSSFRVQFTIYKPNGSGFQGTYRIYVNTSASLTGATLVSGPISQAASGFALAGSIFRQFLIVNQANSTIVVGNTASQFPEATFGPYTNINMSWAVNQYLIISATNNTTTGISQCLGVQIVPQ